MDPNQNPDVEISLGENTSPENLPDQKDNLEIPKVEQAQDISAELPQSTPSDINQTPAQQNPTPQLPVDQSRPIPQAIPDDTPTQPIQEDAGDEIEKPWIEKAEEIIKKNQNFPFEEETEHENLEMDYLKKRFGKELQKNEED